MDQSLFWDRGSSRRPPGTTRSRSSPPISCRADTPRSSDGEAILDKGDFAYLAFPDGNAFGYYSYQFYPYLYADGLGFEYVIPSDGTDAGVYLYDFGLKSFLYTSPTLYPYLYDLNEGAFYFYFVDTTAPRVFYDFGTKQFVYSN